MAYFKYLPKVYVRNRTIQEGNHPYQLTRNIFRRIKIKDHLLGSLLGFTQYSIGEGERPDQVARKFYGDSGLDWMVLIINNIINVYEDWPMNREDLYNYTTKNWGDVDRISHYESVEIFATNGEKVLPEGLVVNEDFQFTRSDGTIVPKEDCRRAVTYYEIEEKKNEQKRNIYLIREEYVTDFLNEFKRLCRYLPHAEVDAEGNKKTPTTIAEEFIGVSSYRKPSQSTASTGSAQGGGSSTALIASGGGSGSDSTEPATASNAQQETTTTSTSSTSSQGSSYDGTTTGSSDSSSSSSSGSSSSSSSSSSGSSSSGSSSSGSSSGGGGGYYGSGYQHWHW